MGEGNALAPTRFGPGPVFVYPGAQAYVNLSGTVANDFFVSGVGSTEANGGIFGQGLFIDPKRRLVIDWRLDD